ncbi:hypothetical protein [Shewanella atlantica]|uniref:Uncharacterized protein n=1 Tax=Shewanella atlantica TaxID=271099 RepID=A0A3S0JTX6_9GAMM|nr:hypothetical protein [Shewanella atlantica]RTR28862.1 hypothetical protein EKG39_17940 [Shewanella atlantica]
MVFSLRLKRLGGILISGLLFALISMSIQASDKRSLTEKADEARKQSRTIEQEQLQKARDAANETQSREKKILKRQQSADWESEQVEKAQQQFNERESREEKYLREAKEAASQERKIPKP